MHAPPMAATTGLPLASTVRITVPSVGSAVALGVFEFADVGTTRDALPAPMRTMAATAAPAFAAMPATMPARVA